MVLGVFPERAKVPETIINAAMFFDDLPADRDIVEKVIKPILTYDRLSGVPTRLTPKGKQLHLQPCGDDLDTSRLVRRVSVEDGSTVVDTIFAHLQDSLAEGRESLPWWEVLVVVDEKGKNEGSKNGGSCVFRIHHGLADGISLVKVFEKIITAEDGTAVKSPISVMERGRMSKETTAEGNGIFSKLWAILGATFEVLTLGATKFDDDILFKKSVHGRMTHSGKRSCVLLPTVDLAFIKELRKAGGVTVNDVLMTAVSQAIHDYCLSRNCPVLSGANKGQVQCRALLPVALPRPRDEINDPKSALSNKFSMVSTNFGVHCNDVMERLRFVNKQTKLLKSSPVAYIQLLAQNTLPPLLPISFGQQTVYDVFTRHSLVFSNVPGPDRPCLFGGKVCTGVQMFYSNLITQIGIISYAGRVYGNMLLDPDAVPDSQSLALFYADALVQLAEHLNVTPPANLVNEAKKQQQDKFDPNTYASLS